MSLTSFNGWRSLSDPAEERYTNVEDLTRLNRQPMQRSVQQGVTQVWVGV